MRGRLHQSRALARAGADRDGIFHSTRSGTTFDDDTVHDYFYKLVKKLGLPRIRLHDLLHLNASPMLQEGVSLATVNARLGHASKAFTLHQSTHALPGVRRRLQRLSTTVSPK